MKLHSIRNQYKIYVYVQESNTLAKSQKHSYLRLYTNRLLSFGEFSKVHYFLIVSIFHLNTKFS